MKSHNFPLYLALPNGKRVLVENWISFDGSFEKVDECSNIYPLGYGLGLFHNATDKIECLLSFSTYNMVRWMDGRYVKIYAGVPYLKMIRSMGRHKRSLTNFYPPNPLESIGGLLGQGYSLFSEADGGEIKIHVISKEEGKIFTSIEDIESRIVIDIHFNKPRPVKNITPSLLIVKLTRSEAEYIFKSRHEIENPFSILEGQTSYYLVSLILDRLRYRSLKDVLSRFLPRDRLTVIGLSTLSIDDIPIVRHVRQDLYLGEYGGDTLDGVLFIHHPSNISVTMDESKLSKLLRRSRYDG